MAKKGASAVERGFGIIKIKLGTTTREDIERVRAIRKAVGRDVVIRVDANQGWDVPTALSVLNTIHNIFFYLDTIRRIRQFIEAQRFDELLAEVRQNL